MTAIPFYKPKPIAPEDSEVARRLQWSLRVSVIGWAMYGLFAFAFADLSVIPGWAQSTLVLIGSGLIVIGSESNTIPTGIAALSKIGTDRFSLWDACAFAASLAGSLCAVLITFSTRQPELAGTWWRVLAQKQGPLVLGSMMTLDFYGALSELAFFKRDYEQAMAVWIEENSQWERDHGAVEMVTLSKEEELVFDPSWPEASIDDARRLISRLNGQLPNLNEDMMRGLLHADEKREKSVHATRRWAREGRKGTL